MLFVLILFAVAFLFLLVLCRFYRRQKSEFRKERNSLNKKLSELKEEEEKLTDKINAFNKKTSLLFAFYDITRLVSPLFRKEKLINTFIDKLISLEDIEKASLSELHGSNCHMFEISKEDGYLYIETQSFSVLRLAPIFARLLAVCFERLRLYDRLQELSVHDYLTGIYNRRYFDQRLDEEFLRAKSLNHNLSFLMLDIDNFKKINDIYGHLVGDVVLKKCALAIAESIRQIDFTGRIGGEEFGVVLVDTDKAGAIMVSERICSRISQQKIKAFDANLTVTTSIGLATYPSNTIYFDLLPEIADKALFRAKASGKDRVCWF